MANLINLLSSRGFNPTSVGGLVTWIDFSDASTLFTDTGRTTRVSADADIIKGVTDKSGNAIHLSEATNGPSYKTGIQASKSVGRFDGTNDLLTSAAITVAQPMTIIVAGKITSVASTRRFLDANVNRAAIYADFTGNKWGFANFTVQSTATAADNNWHVHGCVFSGASSTYRLDAAAQTVGNPGVLGLSTTFFLGRDNAVQFEALDYGELLIYNSALSTPVQQTIEAYLKAKWGTP